MKNKHVVSEKFMCFPALVEDVLQSIGRVRFSQLDLASKMEVTVPANSELTNRLQRVRVSQDPYQWGVNVTVDELRTIFEELRISISIEYFPAMRFEDWSFEECIRRNIANPIICTTEYNTLFKLTSDVEIGHAILILRFVTDKLEVWDPGPENAGVKIVDPFDLYVGAKRKGGGLWVFDNAEEK